jgi:hypothetical protein
MANNNRNTTTLNIVVSADLLAALNIIAHKNGVSLEIAASDMAERGAKDTLYRANRNKQQWEKTKAMKERLAELEEQLGY